jgi:hypothetical protein
MIGKGQGLVPPSTLQFSSPVHRLLGRPSPSGGDWEGGLGLGGGATTLPTPLTDRMTDSVWGGRGRCDHLELERLNE